MLGFDLTAVPTDRQGRCIGHCYDLIEVGERLWCRYTRQWLLGDMYRGAVSRPFQPLSVTRSPAGAWTVVLEKRRECDFDHVLVLRRYRCPGPVAELMAGLRVLKPGELLQLVAFAETMNVDQLSSNVAARGYQVRDFVAFGSGTFAVKIERREAPEQT